MKRTALLYGVLLAFAAFPLAAQQAPDNDAILCETIDKGSPYYYPAIYMRYMSGDTTLTLEDYRHLYYGYAWQPGYKPFETPAAKDRILNILAKDSLAEADYLKIVEYGREVMRSEPYDPSTLNFLVYAYGAVGDSVNERINYSRLKGILAAIESSGGGLSEQSPWHVLYFSHARDLLASMNLAAGKEKVISRTVAWMPPLVKQKGVKGYYFDFGRIYWHKPDKLPEKRSNGWEINGIPLKRRVVPEVRTVE